MTNIINKILTINFSIQLCMFLCFFGGILHVFSFVYITNCKNNNGIIPNKITTAINYAFVLINAICFLSFVLAFIYFDTMQQAKTIFGGFKQSFITIQYSPTIYKALFCFVISLIALCYSIFVVFVFNKKQDFNFVINNIFSNALVLCCLGAFFCIINTSDLFNMYVFIEVLSISLYTSCFLNKTTESAKAGFKYLLIGSLASCIIIFCIIILYHISGHLNIDLIVSSIFNNNSLQNNNNHTLFKICFWLFTFACFIKMSILPIYNWAVNFYTKGNLLFASFSLSITTKIYFYIFYTVIFNIFFAINPQLKQGFSGVLEALLSINIMLFTLFAFFEKNILQILVFSSISNLCYCLIGLFNGGFLLKSVLVLIVGDIFSKFLLFTIICYTLQTNYNKQDLQNRLSLFSPHYFYKQNVNLLNIISNSNGFLKFIFVVCLGIVCSLPPLPTFFAKTNLILLLIERSSYFTSAVLVLSNLIAIGYFIKIILSLIFLKKDFNNQNEKLKLNPIMFIIPSVLISFYFVFTVLLFKLA